MKTELLVREKKPAKAPAAAAAPTTGEQRLRETIKLVLATVQGFQGTPRREILAAAEQAGYTPAEVTAALDALRTNAVTWVDVRQASPAAEAVPTMTAELKPKPFDPHAAGRRLVEALQAAEGGAWTGPELQERFNLSSAVLHRRRKEHRIIYWRDAQHDFHYPRWQFNAAGALLPGIQEILQQFKSQDEWRVMSYFLGQRDQLAGQRPLDLLRQGEIASVLAHTQVHAQENTW